MKPLGIKNYGSIGHLPGSRMGSGDHHIEHKQGQIATNPLNPSTTKIREIFVQEKLDGSNVGIARLNDRIFPLTRSGYVADTSPYSQHHEFHKWVMRQQERFLKLLNNGERVCGEWLYQAHGTKYVLTHEPFIAFDIMLGSERLVYDEFERRAKSAGLTIPYLLHRGEALSVEQAMNKLGKYGHHGAVDEVEGVVYRIEMLQDKNNKKKPRRVEFLCKYVRPDKIDGIYLDQEIINEFVLTPSFK